MKTLSKLLWLGLLMLCVGCQPETEPGGPGATGDDADDHPEATFTLDLPEVSVTQGESADATITLNPGSEFKQKVTVSLTAPAGLSVTPGEVTLTSEQPEQMVAVMAEEAATPGAHMVEVAGTPETGKEVSGQVKVTVEEKTDEGSDS